MFCIPIVYLCKFPQKAIDFIFPLIICLFIFANSFTIGPIKYVYMSEIFPSHLRTNAVQIVLFSELSSSIISSYTLYMIKLLGLSWSFTILAILGFIGVIILKIFAIETYNKTFKEIDIEFINSRNNKYFPSCLECCNSWWCRKSN